jgi:prepilin-type N-terminal cleavage/methylation domain-containing protein
MLMRRVETHFRRKQRERDDAGWSLIEIMVALTISAIAVVLIAPVLTTVVSVTNAANSSSNGNALARQAISQLSTDIGSTTTNNVCFPAAALTTPPTSTCSSINANGTPQTSGYPLVVLSDVYGTCTWYQWNLDASNHLTQQSAVKGATSWGATVPLVGAVINTSSQSLFNLDTTNSVMNIQLVLQGSTGTAVNGSTSGSQNGVQSVDLVTSVPLVTSTSSSNAGSC